MFVCSRMGTLMLYTLPTRNASRVVYTAIADLDADGQVDLLTLSLRESQVEDIGERYGGSCFTLGVYWMRPQRGKPVVGEWWRAWDL